MARRKQLPLSIILPCADTGRETLLRARAWLRYMPPKAELLLTGAMLSAEHRQTLITFAASRDNVRLLQYPDPVALVTQFDRAGRKAEGQFILFLQADVVPAKTTKRLLAAMMHRAGHEGIGAVGGLILEKDGKTIRQAGIFKLPDQPYHNLYFGHKVSKAIRYVGTRTFPYDLRKSRPITAVSYALLVDRLAWRAAGGFPESPDLTEAQRLVDLCRRLQARRRASWYVTGGEMIVQRPIAEEVIPALPAELRQSEAGECDRNLPRLSGVNIPRRVRLSGPRGLSFLFGRRD